MNSLTRIDKTRLKIAFNQEGWTDKIATSHNKLDKIFLDLNIDIYKYVNEKYPGNNLVSKGKKLDTFWEFGTNKEVLAMLNEIYEILNEEIALIVLYGSGEDYTKEIELVDELINKLKDNGVKVDIKQETVTKEMLMPEINGLIGRNQFVLALDKVHTLFIHTIKRKLKDIINFNKRNSIQFLYEKIIENYKLTDVEEIKLTNDKNFSRLFNEFRNNRSFAHDNEDNLMSNEDAKILCESFIISINIIDNLKEKKSS